MHAACDNLHDANLVNVQVCIQTWSLNINGVLGRSETEFTRGTLAANVDIETLSGDFVDDGALGDNFGLLGWCSLGFLGGLALPAYRCSLLLGRLLFCLLCVGLLWSARLLLRCFYKAVKLAGVSISCARTVLVVEDAPFVEAAVAAAVFAFGLAFVAVVVPLGLPGPFVAGFAAGFAAAGFAVLPEAAAALVTLAFVFASGFDSAVVAWRVEVRVAAAPFLGAISVVVSCSLGVFLMYLTPATASLCVSASSTEEM